MKGDDYAASGRVHVTTGSDTALAATVLGSERYFVEMKCGVDDDGVTIEASCDCPVFFDQGTPCKHMWAVLRLADTQGHLSMAAQHQGRVQLELPPLDLDDGFDPGADDALDSVDDEWLEADESTDQAWLFPHHLPPAERRALAERERQRWRDARGPMRARRPSPPHPGAVFLDHLEARVRRNQAAPSADLRDHTTEILYAFAKPTAGFGFGPSLQVMTRSRKKDSEWTVPKPAALTRADVFAAPAPDRRILAMLQGVERAEAWAYTVGPDYPHVFSFGSLGALSAELMPLIVSTGRVWLETQQRVQAATNPYAAPRIETVYRPLGWQDGPPWRFSLDVTRTERGWRVHGALVRGGDRMTLSDLVAVDRWFVWTSTTIARADLHAYVPLMQELLKGSIEVLDQHASRLSLALAEMGVPDRDLPEDLRLVSVDVSPRPCLLLKPTVVGAGTGRLEGTLSFDYDGTVVPQEPSASHFDAARRRLVRRRIAEESQAVARVLSAGGRLEFDPYERRQKLRVPPRQLSSMVSELMHDGWRVEGASGPYRKAASVQLAVASGIDWFDLDATVSFDGAAMPLADVLAALQRRETTILLGDGSVGVLPDDWLRRYLPLAAAGEAVDGRLRFRSPQTALLDALLADAEAHATVNVDEGFRRARDELARSGRPQPIDPPAGFRGALREYQREALGWLQFLDRSAFGGCLADDMGLGKTVMVLAMLAARREAGDRPGPSLIVVPRSLVHNWLDEAARFTPSLRIEDFSRPSRDVSTIPPDADIVLITYGTLRRDILSLKDAAFDYVILDEAQAIKNASTASAKAARLLNGRRRIALTGTPIENHLGELWSLFEFLNPGVLGRSAVFQRAAAAVEPDGETIGLLARGLRPFILRRTKAAVARELPPRTEQTITCELSKPERQLYESLRRHYRDSVLARVEKGGMTAARMHILEALLRLRQAACHPSLVDKTRKVAGSAKLDALLAQVQEVIDAGHKALVFSQFTSLLALVRDELDARKIVYEYLDGSTRDRGPRVARFQEDPACPLFLISLKAGGLGLNLTAADYVFLLDPWWNPAVEAQAIDRTHRIGQTREVMAYRLVAEDTVEEKILQLQSRKKALADAVLSEERGGLRGLEREDLELLLS
jgi:superfamily II DNA or RNA helicase